MIQKLKQTVKQEEGMKVEGLVVNQLLSKFKEGQALIRIQNEKETDIGILILKTPGLVDQFRQLISCKQKIKISLETQKNWKEETIKGEDNIPRS